MEGKLSIPAEYFTNYKIGLQEIKELYRNIENVAEFRKTLRDLILKPIKDYTQHRKEIILDFFTQLYKFSLEKGFSLEQILIIYNIALYLIINAVEQRVSIFESYEAFQVIIKRHTHNFEPYSKEYFSPEQIQTVSKYFRHTLFKHFTMFEIALTHFVDYNIYTADPIQENWPKLCSLDEGFERDPLKTPGLGEYNKEKIEENKEETKAEPEEEKPVEEEEKPAEEKAKELENKVLEEVPPPPEKTADDLLLERTIESKIKVLEENMKVKCSKSEEAVFLEAETLKKKK